MGDLIKCVDVYVKCCTRPGFICNGTNTDVAVLPVSYGLPPEHLRRAISEREGHVREPRLAQLSRDRISHVLTVFTCCTESLLQDCALIRLIVTESWPRHYSHSLLMGLFTTREWGLSKWMPL